MSEATSYLAETAPQTGPSPVAPAHTAAQPEATTAPAEPSGDEAHLHSIFPDLDSATIHDCYVLCDRNVERTVEFLLGDASTNVTTAQTGMSQSDIDEQLARHLEQEELSAAAANQQRAWAPQQEQVPVAPRQPTSLRSGQTAPSDGPDFQEQFNKIAETGKRTFNTIFNKVKEKLKEFDQPPPGSGPSSSQPYYAPEATHPPGMVSQPQVAPVTSPYQQHQANYAPPAGPPLGHERSQATTTESSATPSSSTAANANANATAAPVPPIDVSKAAFLAKKPTPLTETSKPHPEDDLTENPFDERTH